MLRLIAALLFVVTNLSGLSWTTDYHGALAQAKAENKPIVLFFTGSDWCAWCKKLDEEVFSKPEFASQVGNKFIFMEVDFPKKNPIAGGIQVQNQELQKKFNVKSFPTVILIDGNEKVLGNTGYKAGGPQQYASHLQSLVGK